MDKEQNRQKGSPFEAELSNATILECLKQSRRGHTRSSSQIMDSSKARGKKATRLIIVTLSIFFFSLLSWSFVAKIQEVASARGELVSISDIEFVQHLEGGMIDEYFVSRGDIVQKGDLIATLSDSTRASQNTISRAKLEIQYLTKERLNALMTNRKPNFEQFSKDKSLIDVQMGLLKGLIADQREEANYFNEIIQNKRGVLRSMYARLKSSKKQLALIDEQVAMRSKLYKKQGGSKLDLTNVKIQRLNMQREVETLRENILILKDTISETAIQKKQALKTRLLNYSAEYKEVQDSISELVEVRKIDVDKHDRLTIRSPVYGVVRELPIRYSSAILEASGIVAEIVPLGKGLKAEIHIPPKNIGFVSVGQSVNIKLDAYDFSKFGTVDGVVSRISTGTFKDPQSNEVYYLGEVELKSESVSSLGHKHVLVPGMEMTADIKIGERKVIDYIAKPIIYGLNEAFREK
jgi:HlyD family secretion protein/adhesin transport system membrane fusion protein